MKNKEYFEYCLTKPDTRLDLSNPLGFLVISKNTNETPTLLMTKNQKLIELITTYKTIRNTSGAESTIKSVVNDIFDIIKNKNIKINYSPFLTYLQVLNYSANDFIKDLNKSDEDTRMYLIRTVLDNYIDNRHNMYLSHSYSDSMLQIRADCSASRTNSVTGNKMIEEMLKPLHISQAISSEDFIKNDKLFICPDRGDKAIFKNFLKSVNYNYKFKQDKLPDMVIKANGKIYFIEHKIVNSGGGHQNEQLDEVISFINQSHKNVYFISCLAGAYFNQFNKSSAPKVQKQKNDILEYLNNYENNYFVNNNGLAILLKELLKR